MNTHTFSPVALSLSNQINRHKETLTTDDIKMLMLTLQMCTNAPNLLDKEDRCQGITDSGCGYLSSCNKICNKCGKFHNGHKPPADDVPLKSPIVDEGYNEQNAIRAGVEKLLIKSHGPEIKITDPVTAIDDVEFIEFMLECEEHFNVTITDEQTGKEPADVSYEEAVNFEQFVNAICKKKGYAVPTT